MSIAQQFSGLPMNELIGAPLSAAADASIRLADSTAGFINKVGFDKDGKVRTVAFGYTKKTPNEDGTSKEDSLQVDVPMLAIVPIPNLQVDEVNILFDMEVKTSEKSESSLDLEARAKASIGFGMFKAEVSGSVSSHSSNTRSSDNSAKYHVDVKAANHGIPEGLARVLDMLATNVSPSLVGTTIKDGDGKELSEEKRKKAETVQNLKKEADAAKIVYSNADSNLDRAIKNLINEAEIRLKKYDTQYEYESEKTEEKTKAMDEVRSSWTTFKQRVRDWIAVLADEEGELKGVAPLFKLKKYDKGAALDLDNDEVFVTLQSNAINAQKNYNKAKLNANEKQTAYDEALMAK